MHQTKNNNKAFFIFKQSTWWAICWSPVSKSPFMAGAERIGAAPSWLPAHTFQNYSNIITSEDIWLEIALLLRFGSVAFISPWLLQARFLLEFTPPKNIVSHLGHNAEDIGVAVMMLPCALQVCKSRLFCCRLSSSVRGRKKSCSPDPPEPHTHARNTSTTHAPTGLHWTNKLFQTLHTHCDPVLSGAALGMWWASLSSQQFILRSCFVAYEMFYFWLAD